MPVISGAYSAQWNAVTLGNANAGYRVNHSYQGRDIRFDSVGTTPVDTIETGLGMTIDFVLMEYDLAAVKAIRWPFHPVEGIKYTAGSSMWSLAKPLILTSCLTGVNPQTITFYKTILAPNFGVEINFSGVMERMVPMRLHVFPVGFDAGGYTIPTLPNGCGELVYFETTNWT